VRFVVTIIWDVTVCSLVDKSQRFRGTCCFHLQVPSTLITEAVYTSETFVPRSYWCLIPGDSNLQIYLFYRYMSNYKNGWISFDSTIKTDYEYLHCKNITLTVTYIVLGWLRTHAWKHTYTHPQTCTGACDCARARTHAHTHTHKVYKHLTTLVCTKCLKFKWTTLKG
jgi:hypothetical protein